MAFREAGFPRRIGGVENSEPVGVCPRASGRGGELGARSGTRKDRVVWLLNKKKNRVRS